MYLDDRSLADMEDLSYKELRYYSTLSKHKLKRKGWNVE